MEPLLGPPYSHQNISGSSVDPCSEAGMRTAELILSRIRNRTADTYRLLHERWDSMNLGGYLWRYRCKPARAEAATKGREHGLSRELFAAVCSRSVLLTAPAFAVTLFVHDVQLNVLSCFRNVYSTTLAVFQAPNFLC